ncbi:MAG: putative lipid II flippase FtsW [Candidatus Kapabacteria bacterium]|nr:putative lipid II flippase FtsW [Candidatus Kapabacteria bacterium]
MSNFTEDTKIKGHIDWYILLPIIGLMLFSIAFVYSASYTISDLKLRSTDNLFIKHGINVLLGIIVMIITSAIDYQHWKKISKYGLIGAIILLVIVIFHGAGAKGATRWISLGFVRFQPSELAKFALVIHFATLLSQKQKVIKSFNEGFLPFLLWTGLVCVLIALQPNFSNTAVIFLIAFSMMFIGNINLLHLSSMLVVCIIGGGIFAVSATYRLNRILAYLGMGDGSAATENVNYQLNQALLAIGNGGIHGVGAGQSRQSHMFLPESYGDFIFSVIGEEYGFIGLTLIILAFVMIFWRGMSVAKKAPDNFGYYLAVGILVTFAFYVFVNAGVNTGLLPTTGVPFPFLSYGGTAILIYSFAMGILLNISAQANVYPRNNFEQDLDDDDEVDEIKLVDFN